jgi:hypothetical protein
MNTDGHGEADADAETDPMDIDEDEDAPGEIDDDILPTITNGDSSESTKGGYHTNGVKSSDTPPDSTGYVGAPEQPPPPTPPMSNGGSLVSNGHDGTTESTPSVSEGGIPTYIKNTFDPIGTTVLESKWAGREAAMSEDLSEIGDEELHDMSVGMEGLEGTSIEDIMRQEKAEAAAQAAKKSKAKKRRRNW